MAPKIIRDLSDSSGYWAAIWTICPMPDVHVICDAPVGCFNLVGTAVPDYTDAIPHIENLTPATMTEQEVGGKGTSEKVRWTYENLRDSGALEGKRLIVVSTAESEMIGADHTKLVETFQPGTTFYYSNSLSEDEWTGRDRVLRWLWENYGARGGELGASDVLQPSVSDPQARTVNIIGPTYGCFNAPSDLEELKRLIQGAGGTINLVYPYEAKLADTPRLAGAQVNVLLSKEFGQGLATALGQETLAAPFGMHETTAFIRRLGELFGTQEQAEAFIAHEKKTTLRAVWDLWKGPQSDWFPTSSVGIVAGQSYAEGLARYLGEELGMPIAFVGARPLRPGDPDNETVRQMLHKRAPAFVFGSINEKIYLSEAGARFTNFIPAAFPGPVVRRSVGTPFVGYRGAVHLVQEIVNRLYETLFNFLPVDGAYAKNGAGGPPAGPPQPNAPGNLPWQPAAQALLDAALEKLPYIPRISASREFQMKAENLARTQGIAEVTVEIAEAALKQ
ncbi:MAG: chlorophyllide a reductase subunit Z [Roseiflexaceae bacterium]|nr:chlorophyllide a reductase subunit Z [Roseiflexaceae bacterium]